MKQLSQLKVSRWPIFISMYKFSTASTFLQCLLITLLEPSMLKNGLCES